MLKLEAVEAFAAVAESGSMTGAARRLELSKSVISERLAELERVLGAKLVHRTTRTLMLTDDGRTFYESAKRILEEVNGAAAALAARRGTLNGALRISAPVSFGSLHLGAALFGFLAKHPAIDVTLDLEDRFVNLLSEGYDAAIRHGPVEDKRFIVKHLATSRRLLVASPAYLKRHGRPAAVAELAQHRGVIYSQRGAADWRLRVGRKFATVHPHTALRVNNGLLMRDAAVAGLGIALLPTFFLPAVLKERKLKVLDVGAEAEGATIFIAYPERLRTSAKILALTQWLRTALGDPPYWDAAIAQLKND